MAPKKKENKKERKKEKKRKERKERKRKKRKERKKERKERREKKMTPGRRKKTKIPCAKATMVRNSCTVWARPNVRAALCRGCNSLML
jgi:hypothetical protein